LRALPVLVLSLQVTFFIDYWFGEYFDHVTPLLRLIEKVAMGLTASLLLIYIVLYFWRTQNRPHFHVLFIRRKEEQKQKEAENFLIFSLIPVGISVGLSFFIMLCYYWLSIVFFDPFGYFSMRYVDIWWTPYNTNEFLMYYPLIFVVFFFIGLLVSLYFICRIIPGIRTEHIQRSFFLLLFIAIGASISVLVSQLVGYLSNLMKATYNIAPFFEILNESVCRARRLSARRHEAPPYVFYKRCKFDDELKKYIQHF
jgi:phage shock protein PspC (stress-responsive transcriptional regulator)